MRKIVKNKDNRGIALVSVMIVMTVVMLMATLIVELAYTSLLSRRVNTRSTKNFYAAQSALDDMSTVLQSIAVYSAKELENSTSKTDGFIEVAERTLQSAAGISSSFGGKMSEADSKKMSKFFFDNLTPEVKQVLGKKVVVKNPDGSVKETKYEYDEYKLRVTAAMKSLTNGTKEKGAITLTIELNYEDENGYMTNISTDLVMNNVVNRPPPTAYNLGSYALFTGGGIKFGSNDGFDGGGAWQSNYGTKYGAFIQEGNAYIGTQENSSTALTVSQNGLIIEGNRAIINGDVEIFDGGVLSFPGGSSSGGAKTMIDIRGTVYIDDTSVLVLGKGVDLLVNDIKVSPKHKSNDSNWKASATSIFSNSGSVTQYSHGSTTKVSGKSNYPYEQALATLKSDTWLSSNTNGADMLSAFQSSQMSGGVVYTDGTDSYLLKCVYKGTVSGTDTYKFYTVNGNNAVDDLILNRDDSLGPIAKATFWGYDGTTHTVDSELANFVNLDVMYFQAMESGGGGYVDLDNSAYLGSGKTLDRNQTLKYEVKTSDYTFKGVSLVNGYKTSDFISGTNVTKKNLSSYKLSDPIDFGGTSKDTVQFIMGNVWRDLDSSKGIIWSNQWRDQVLQCTNGKYIGTVISAQRADYKNMSHKVSIGYAFQNGDQESFKKLLDEIKFISFGKSLHDWVNNWGSKCEKDKLYGLTMIDSLYKGGVHAFLNSGSDETAGGPVTFDVTSMYDFITVENWKTN